MILLGTTYYYYYLDMDMPQASNVKPAHVPFGMASTSYSPYSVPEARLEGLVSFWNAFTQPSTAPFAAVTSCLLCTIVY